MKSVAQLRAAGFTVTATPPAMAEGCTLITSATAFYCYKPKFVSTPQELAARLEQSYEDAQGQHYLIIAGEHFGDDQDLPLEIVTAAEEENLQLLRQRWADAEVVASEHRRAFESAAGKILRGEQTAARAA